MNLSIIGFAHAVGRRNVALGRKNVQIAQGKLGSVDRQIECIDRQISAIEGFFLGLGIVLGILVLGLLAWAAWSAY